MSRRSLKVIAGLAGLSLLAAACSSTSSSSTTSTTVKATGTPIVVGQIVPMTGANLAEPVIGDSMTASVQALNDSGGINGHPLKLIQCDSKGDPTIEAQCAQQLVNDHVVATLGDFTFANATQDNQILAGIPRIGITEFQPSDYANRDNFAFQGGGILSLAGYADGLINKGDKKISMMLPDSATAGQVHLLLDPIVKAQGAEVVNYVLVNSASGDYSQYIAQAQQNGAQGVASALGNAQAVQIAQAWNQLHPKIDYSLGVGSFNLNQMKQLKPYTTGATFVDWTPAIDDTKNFPGIAPVLAVMTKYMKGATVGNMNALPLQSWMAVHALSEVMKPETGTPTAASIIAGFKAAKDIPMNGIIKPWTPTDYQDAGIFNALFPTVSNPYMYVIKFNGTNTSTNQSTLFSTLAGTSPTTTTTSK